MKIKLSKNQWEEMGKKAGWMKKAEREENAKKVSEKYYEIIEKLLLTENGRSFIGKFLFHNFDIVDRILNETPARVMFPR